MEGDGAQGSVPFYRQSGSSQFYTIQNTLLGSSWLIGIFLNYTSSYGLFSSLIQRFGSRVWTQEPTLKPFCTHAPLKIFSVVYTCLPIYSGLLYILITLYISPSCRLLLDPSQPQSCGAVYIKQNIICLVLNLIHNLILYRQICFYDLITDLQVITYFLYYVGNFKGIGKVYSHVFIDSYSREADATPKLMTLSEAIRIFIKQSSNSRGLPFKPHLKSQALKLYKNFFVLSMCPFSLSKVRDLL